MVNAADGLSMAKRQGNTRFAAYREAGVPVERVVGLLAQWACVNGSRVPMWRGSFRSFSIWNVCRLKDVVFRDMDDMALRYG